MSNFAVVIGYKFKDEEYTTIVLDAVNDTTVNGSSTITDQPLVSGDITSDHSFIQPKTMSVSGIISMNGSNVTTITGSGSKMANFQTLMERLQQEAVLCDIVKLSLTNEKDVRFLHRQNMVLQSFTWTEAINSLSYSLSFRQVLLTEAVVYDVAEDDEFLPNVTEPTTSSFTTELIDWDQIELSIVNFLLDEDLMSETFLANTQAKSKDALIGLCGLAVGMLLATTMAVLNTTPVGWALTAVAALVGGVVFLVKGLISLFSSESKLNKWRIDAFEWSNNDSKNDAEIKRFGNFLSDMHNEFTSLNDAIHVYRLSESTPQECMISIGDDYYILTFTQNNLDHTWSVKCTDINDSTVGTNNDIASAPTSFDELTNDNMLFTANNNSKCYVAYVPVVNEDETLDSTENMQEDLTNYLIIVCDFDVTDFQNIVNDIIKNALIRKS